MNLLEKLEDVRDFIESQVDSFRARADFNERSYEVMDIVTEMRQRGENESTITVKIAKLLSVGIPTAMIIIKALTGVWVFGWLLW